MDELSHLWLRLASWESRQAELDGLAALCTEGRVAIVPQEIRNTLAGYRADAARILEILRARITIASPVDLRRAFARAQYWLEHLEKIYALTHSDDTSGYAAWGPPMFRDYLFLRRSLIQLEHALATATCETAHMELSTTPTTIHASSESPPDTPLDREP